MAPPMGGVKMSAERILRQAEKVAEAFDQHQENQRKATGLQLEEDGKRGRFNTGYTDRLRRLAYSPILVASWCHFRNELRTLKAMLQDADRKETGDDNQD